MLYLGIDAADAGLDCCAVQHLPDQAEQHPKAVSGQVRGADHLLGWLRQNWPAMAFSKMHVTLSGEAKANEALELALRVVGVRVARVDQQKARLFARTVLGIRCQRERIDSHVLALYGLHTQAWRAALSMPASAPLAA